MDVSELELVGRVALAVLLGGVVGIEREIDAKTAGFRTHILICLGAALFGLISVAGFGAFEAARGDTNVNIDVTRVASQVVVGIGFIGGGAILKWGGSVRGLTTAASVWTVAAVGLAVGVGYYAAAVVVTVAVLVSLFGLRFVSQLARRWARQDEIVTIRLRPEADATAVLDQLDDVSGTDVRGVRLSDGGREGGFEITAQMRSAPGASLKRVLTGLAGRDDVEEVSFEDR